MARQTFVLILVSFLCGFLSCSVLAYFKFEDFAYRVEQTASTTANHALYR